MDSERGKSYEKITNQIEQILEQKELGPELEEIFKYYKEVLSGEIDDKKYYVSAMAEDLISRVKNFPNRVLGSRR